MLKRLRRFPLSRNGGQSGSFLFSGVNIPLDLAQGDGTFRHTPIRMKDSVLRIPPPLLHQTPGGAPHILDESVPIHIAVVIDPG